MQLVACGGAEVSARRPGASTAAVVPAASPGTLTHGVQLARVDVGYGRAQRVKLLFLDNEQHRYSFLR